MNVKQQYGKKFALPADQVCFFGELNESQVEDVQRYFSSGLIGVDNYIYAVKRSGQLVWSRHRRDLLMEKAANLTPAAPDRQRRGA